MAHINQRDAREQRRRKKLSFLLIFLFVPLVLAGYFLVSILSQNLNAQTVDEILLTDEKTSTQITLTDRESITLCMDVLARAKAITESARPLSEYRQVQFVCSDEYTKETYLFCFSDSANDTLIVNEENKVYMLSAEDATALMLSDCFSFLYQTEPGALTMTVGEETYSPAPSYTWHYFGADETEQEKIAEAPVETYEVRGVLPTFSIALEPDETKLTVTVGNDVKTGAVGDLASLLPAEGGKAEMCITATWSNPEADGYYGTAEYRFILDYTPAEA